MGGEARRLFGARARVRRRLGAGAKKKPQVLRPGFIRGPSIKGRSPPGISSFNRAQCRIRMSSDPFEALFSSARKATGWRSCSERLAQLDYPAPFAAAGRVLRLAPGR